MARSSGFNQFILLKLSGNPRLCRRSLTCAQPIVSELRANRVCLDSDFSATPFKAKIADVEKLRVHTMLIISGKDTETRAVSARLHHSGPQGVEIRTKANANILADIKECGS